VLCDAGEKRVVVDIELVVTDLDNTLYDWVTFFASAFYAMISRAAEILEVPESALLDECQAVHRFYGDSEAPFALLDTPTVRERYKGRSRQEQATLLDSAFHAFNRERDKTLKLYPGVLDFLTRVRPVVPIVGHTEASSTNAFFRLKKLGVDHFVTPLYALEHTGGGHPDAARAVEWSGGLQSVRLLRQDERKPDPRVLLDICRDQGVAPDRTLYIGDSLARDIGMAKAVGAWAAWAKYGTTFQKEMWDRLVRITHWTPEDVQRARHVQERFGHVKPDRVLQAGLHELIETPDNHDDPVFRFVTPTGGR